MPEFTPDDLSSTAWAFATLHVRHGPLLEAIAGASVATCGEFSARNLTDTAWAFATLACPHPPLLQAISSAAVAKRSQWATSDLTGIAWSFAALRREDRPLLDLIAPASEWKLASGQELANMAWSLAKLRYADQPLLEAIAAGSLARISAFNGQQISNLAWSCATLQLAAAPLFAQIACQTFARMSEFDAQVLSSLAWSFAKLMFFDIPLMESIAAAACARISCFAHDRELTTLAWSYATLELRHEPLLQEIAARSVAIIGEFGPLGIMNMSWSFAVLAVADARLLSALAAQAQGRLPAFAPQNIALTAWAFASLRYADAPLMDALSSAALRKISECRMHHISKLAWANSVLQLPPAQVHPFLSVALAEVDLRLDQMNAPGAHSLLWALWAAAHPAHLGEVFEGWLRRGVDLGDMSTASDVLLMDAEWRRDRQELFWLSLLSASSRTGAPQAVISKWAAGASVPPWVCNDAGLWDVSKVERNKPELSKYMQRYELLRKWVQPTSGNHWDKLSTLIEFVDERLPRGAPAMPESPLRLLGLLETYAQSREHWLKVAGGGKAEVLEHAFASRRWEPFEVAVECGAFVGYSASRLAVQMWRRGRGAQCMTRVVTIEVDPVQACIARHFVDLVGLSQIVEVCIGQVKDVLPRVVESFGGRSAGLIFMDYKGSIFHQDLALLERIGGVARGGLEIADNVALPGAPLLLWHLAFGPSWELTAYAMMEFFEPNTEDWMALGTYRGPLGPAPPAPASWRKLSWHTDHMRRRACGLRPTEGDMFETDRVAYSRYVRRHFREAGIEAVPWTGPVPGD